MPFFRKTSEHHFSGWHAEFLCGILISLLAPVSSSQLALLPLPTMEVSMDQFNMIVQQVHILVITAQYSKIVMPDRWCSLYLPQQQPSTVLSNHGRLSWCPSLLHNIPSRRGILVKQTQKFEQALRLSPTSHSLDGKCFIVGEFLYLRSYRQDPLRTLFLTFYGINIYILPSPPFNSL